VRSTRAFGGAVAGTVGAVVLLVAVRLAAPTTDGVRPEAALPVLVAIALLLVAVLARDRAPTIAWLAVIGAGIVATIDLAVAARSIRDVVEVSTWRWLTVAVGLAALWTTGSAMAYAAEPRRRLGSWVPVVGIVGLGVVALATAWAVAGAEVALDPATTGVGPTGLVTRTFLLVTAVGALLGLAGDARAPWARARQRVTLASAGASPPRSTALAGAFLEEIAPGRSRARQAVLAERARLARDLHADVMPGLRRAVALAEDGDDLDALTAQLRTTLAEVEDLGTAAHAVQLDVGGLLPAIEALAERVESTSDVTVTIDVLDPPRVDDGEPPAAVAAAALRVVRLALDNTVRHAPGARVVLTVDARPDALTVAIVDDGPGLATDRSDAALAGRRGLADMATEAAASGARLEVGTAPTGGTRVWFGWGDAADPA
jgi:signal transduction histidine kinase